MPANWDGAVAIVTGAASGIGLALSSALLKRGAIVWMVDVNAAEVVRVAGTLGPKAHSAGLDVRDALRVRDFIERVARDSRRLDFLFNNAGINCGGEVQELAVDHFDRIIDINIRGVVNGTIAAYPLMLKQRSGHIVNTASAWGLIPAPLQTPYAMTKYAVVGFSSSLRLEAVNYGVRVSALCPGPIETPLLDSGNAPDLPRVASVPSMRRYATNLQRGRPPYPVASLADDALRGVEHNQGLIIVPARTRISTFLYRIAPGLVDRAIGRAVVAERKARSTTA